jgi:hypothetical protein
MKRAFTSIVAGTALATAFAVSMSIGASAAAAHQPAQAGTMRTPASLKAQQDQTKATPMGADSCSFGWFVCPDDSSEWLYASASACVDFCGADGTKSSVLTQCNNYCVAACVAGDEWFTCQ